MSTFKIGDIVDVTGKGLMFQGQQGQVVAVTTDDQAVETIHVWHGTECDYLLDHRTRQNLDPQTEKEPPTADQYVGDLRTWRYVEANLILAYGWKPEVVADRLFGHDHWHSIDVCPPSNACPVCDRDMPDQKVLTYFNCWGTVMVLTTCSACHKRNHGVCGDSLSKR